MIENENLRLNQRPMSCRPQTSVPKKVQSKESRGSSQSSLKDITESEVIDQSSCNSAASKGNFDILDTVMKGKQKENFENLIKEEANRLELIHKQKKNLGNINLLEKNIEGLYDWKTLFNNSRPLSSYTKLKNPIKSNLEEAKKPFEFPIALIDASEETVAQYIPYINIDQFPQKKKKSRPFTTKLRSFSESQKQMKPVNTLPPRKGNATRPQSMYSKREQTDTFYLSKPFSDYYNEDLKTFSKKMPLVRAKVAIKKEKLQRTLKVLKKQTMMKENTLRKVKLRADLDLTPLELNIAGNLKNCKPLLKTIYKQIHPEAVEKDPDFDPVQKSYLKSTKPLGTVIGEIDCSKNDRSGHIEEFRKLRDDFYVNKKVRSSRIGLMKGLSLETYDENDPEIEIFKRIKEESEVIEEENDFNQSPNYIVTHTTNHNDDIDDHLKITDHKTNEVRTLAQIKNKPRPKTGLIISSQSLSGARNKMKQQRININTTRPQTSNQHSMAFKGLNNQLTSVDLKSSYPNVNSSGSIYNTCSSSAAFDYIPIKSMPLRTVSAITNRTYQKIDQNIKNKAKKHKENYILTEELIRNTAYGIKKTDTNVQTSSRPQSSMYSNEYIKNKLEKINKNQRPEWNHIMSPASVNYIYFNDYIDTNFIPTAPNTQVGFYKFKHFHEQNYYNTNCFNKGTCARQLSGRKRNLFSDNIKSNRINSAKVNYK